MYGKMTYTATTALKEEFIIYSSQEEGHVTPTEPHEETSGLVRRWNEVRGKLGSEPLLWFSGREWTRQDRQVEQVYDQIV